MPRLASIALLVAVGALVQVLARQGLGIVVIIISVALALGWAGGSLGGRTPVATAAGPGIITTFAGGGSATAPPYGDGGPATGATLQLSGGVAVDSVGNIYVADSSHQRVRKVSSDGTITTFAGGGSGGSGSAGTGDGGPATSAVLDSAYGIAVDGSDNVYVSDYIGGRVRMISGGIITTFATVISPFGVAVDGGNVYIAQYGPCLVLKVTGGVISTFAGTGTCGVGGEGEVATSSQLSYAAGVAVDGSGNVYIADQVNCRVRKVTGGIITTVAGTGTCGFGGDGLSATSANLYWPSGLLVDGGGNVYIGDYYNCRVRKVSGGVITTIAGNGSCTSSGDGGLATSAGLNYPDGLAFDNAGNLYIAEGGLTPSSFGRISKVSAPSVGGIVINFTYDASVPWADTGVDVAAGTTITMTATGLATWDTRLYTDPNGVGALAGWGNCRLQSLVAWVGAIRPTRSMFPIADVQCVGTSYSWTSAHSGRLYVHMNDYDPGDPDEFRDNSGTWTIGGVVELPATATDTPTNTPFTPSITPTDTPTPTTTPVANAGPAQAKVPEGSVASGNVDLSVPKANLFLCTTGPCAGPGEGDLVVVERVSNITTGDSNGDMVQDGLGAYEFNVEYDNFVIQSVNPSDIVFSAGGAGASRGPASCTFSLVLENIVRFGCVTTGSTPNGPIGSFDLAKLDLVPHPDLMNDLFPGNDNGVPTVIKDNGCELADVFGHPVLGSVGGGLLPTCGDLAVTVRILEGDLNLDCKVDVTDEQLIGVHYASVFGSAYYSTWFDLEPRQHDLDIDIKDLQKVFGRDGSTCQQPIPEQTPVDPAAPFGA